MHSFLKQSTASQSRSIGPFLDDTDFKTEETALTIANTDIKLMINGAASANKNSGGGTHRANGVYGITFDATDTATVGEMFVSVKVAGALPVFATFVVVEEAIYDALFAASANAYTGAAGSTVARADLINIAGAAVSTSTAQLGVNVVQAAGTAWGSGAITAASIAADAITAAKIADGAIDAATFAAGAINAAAIATDAIDAAEIAAGAGTEIATAVWASATRTLTANTNLNDLSAAGVRAAVGLASANLDTQLTAIDDFIDTEVAAILAAVDTEVGAIKAVTDALPDAGALTSLATQASVNTIDDFLDTEIAAIKAKTDGLTFTVAGVLDANVQRINDVVITGDGQVGTEFGV